MIEALIMANNVHEEVVSSQQGGKSPQGIGRHPTLEKLIALWKAEQDRLRRQAVAWIDVNGNIMVTSDPREIHGSATIFLPHL